MSLERRYKQEATLTKYVKEYLHAQPDTFFKKISDRFQSGIPDILACVGGRFVAIELKKDTGRPTKAQQAFIKSVQKAGGVGGVCYSIADVMRLIEEARR